MIYRRQCTDQGPPAWRGPGEISAPVQHDFKQGPQFPVLHGGSTLMVLPVPRETKAGLGWRKGTPRYPRVVGQWGTVGRI